MSKKVGMYTKFLKNICFLIQLHYTNKKNNEIYDYL